MLVAVILWNAKSNKSVSEQDIPMEIVFEDTKPTLVTVPDQLEDSDDKNNKKAADFASNKRRRVELETLKRQNKSGIQSPIAGGGQTRPNPQQKNQKQKQTLAANDPDGIEYKTTRKPLKLPFSQASSAQSLLPQYVKEQLPPGVRLGEVTALNTDQHLFYNFHQRLLSRFVPNWGRLVGRAVRQWIEREGQPKTSKTWVTNIEVIMDPSGEVLDVQHYRLSGYWPIDEAPSKAFAKHVRRIPNPPTQMVDENGYIRLKFQTEVYWVPQAPPRRFNSDRKSY